ncbi:hypothetical protein LIA77_04305 [Sarocladium implicatum]|nr:hypothetical protein LIA77_04305 [Sarocladium implicatum]
MYIQQSYRVTYLLDPVISTGTQVHKSRRRALLLFQASQYICSITDGGQRGQQSRRAFPRVWRALVDLM